MQGRTTTDLLASPATTALSNTSLRLRCVKELHSTYVSQPELILVYNSKKKINNAFYLYIYIKDSKRMQLPLPLLYTGYVTRFSKIVIAS